MKPPGLADLLRVLVENHGSDLHVQCDEVTLGRINGDLGQFDLNAVNLARGVARQAGQAILNALHREEEEARSRHSRQFVRF